MYLIVFGSLSNCLSLRLDRFLCRRIGVLGYCSWVDGRAVSTCLLLGHFWLFCFAPFYYSPYSY